MELDEDELKLKKIIIDLGLLTDWKSQEVTKCPGPGLRESIERTGMFDLVKKMPEDFVMSPLGLPTEVGKYGLVPSNTSVFYWPRQSGEHLLCYSVRQIDYEIVRAPFKIRLIRGHNLHGRSNLSFTSIYLPSKKNRMKWSVLKMDFSKISPIPWSCQFRPATVQHAVRYHDRIRCVQDLRMYSVGDKIEGYCSIILESNEFFITPDAAVAFFEVDVTDLDNPVARFEKVICPTMKVDKNHVPIIGTDFAISSWGGFGGPMRYYNYKTSDFTKVDWTHSIPQERIPAFLGLQRGSSPANRWPLEGDIREYWLVTHSVFGEPYGKKYLNLYYHSFVVLQPSYPYEPLAFTIPLSFSGSTTEFTLNFVFKDNDTIILVITKMDWYPTEYEIPLNWLRERLVRVDECLHS